MSWKLLWEVKLLLQDQSLEYQLFSSSNFLSEEPSWGLRGVLFPGQLAGLPFGREPRHFGPDIHQGGNQPRLLSNLRDIESNSVGGKSPIWWSYCVRTAERAIILAELWQICPWSEFILLINLWQSEEEVIVEERMSAEVEAENLETLAGKFPHQLFSLFSLSLCVWSV